MGWKLLFDVNWVGCPLLVGRLYCRVCLMAQEAQSESWCWFCRLGFWNLLGPIQFSLTLSTWLISERWYDWLIEHQQPGEIQYHGPGLYFPFLLKFLLTHSPRAFKPSLISFRAPRFDQSNLCTVFWSHVVQMQRRQQPNITYWSYWGPVSLQNHLPYPGCVHTFELHNYRSTPCI